MTGINGVAKVLGLSGVPDILRNGEHRRPYAMLRKEFECVVGSALIQRITTSLRSPTVNPADIRKTVQVQVHRTYRSVHRLEAAAALCGSPLFFNNCRCSATTSSTIRSSED